KDSSAVRIVLDPDGSSMRFNHDARNRQAESETLPVALLSLLALMKRVEGGFFVRVSDTGARIRNSNQRKAVAGRSSRHAAERRLRHARILADGSHVDSDGAAFIRKTNRIFEEVREELDHAVWIAFNKERLALNIGQDA